MNRDVARAFTAARSLGDMGYACFPCGPHKRPLTPNGFKDATADREAIEELWCRYPGVLVGVATGTMSGVSVLDIDKRHRAAHEWWAAHRDKLPATRTHRTRSGGLHLIYRHRDGIRNSEGLIAKGVDTRGQGGYAIWWPCIGLPVLADPGIQAWPDWLTVKAPAPVIAPPSPISRRAIAARDLRPMLHRATGILRTVVEASEGERNRLLFWATCKCRDMCIAGELDHPPAMQVLDLLREAADRAGLPRREVERTIASAFRSRAAA
jgi:hypothetical protein